MSEIKIYHNPRCQKSRTALSVLKENGFEPEVVEYLKTIPNAKELALLLAKLNLNPIGIVRKSEQLFKEKFKGKNFTNEEWIQILTENPILIERPIVVKGNRAVIGRPIDNVLELIS